MVGILILFSRFASVRRRSSVRATSYIWYICIHRFCIFDMKRNVLVVMFGSFYSICFASLFALLDFERRIIAAFFSRKLYVFCLGSCQMLYELFNLKRFKCTSWWPFLHKKNKIGCFSSLNIDWVSVHQFELTGSWFDCEYLIKFVIFAWFSVVCNSPYRRPPTFKTKHKEPPKPNKQTAEIKDTEAFLTIKANIPIQGK